MYTLYLYIVEKFPTLKHCSRIPCPATLLSCSQFGNFASVYLIVLHCWEVPNIKTLLSYYLSCYFTALLSFLKHCWERYCLIRLLRRSRFLKIADVHRVLLNCSSVPNLKILLRHIYSFYNVEKFPIAEKCWRISRLVAMLSCSQFENFLNVYLIVLHCWEVPNLETLLTYSLSCYIASWSQFWNIANAYPIVLHNWEVPTLKHCWRNTSLVPSLLWSHS